MKKLLLIALFSLAALHCGGTEEDAPAEAEEALLGVFGPWGSCTLTRDGIKVPAYYDPATGCCCYNGDCEIQMTTNTVSTGYLAR